MKAEAALFHGVHNKLIGQNSLVPSLFLIHINLFYNRV